MRSGLDSGVRCDNRGSVLRDGRTFEGLYDTGAGWHDEEDKKREKGQERKRLGGGTKGQIVGGRDGGRVGL
jgi:hypothetical protein